MKERPIIFSDAMVRAILAGTKTQTRQVVKNKAVLDSLNEVGSWDGPGEVEDWERSMCPYGAPGDRLWARETHQIVLHMPRCASRITLEIVNVKVQRVQEISEDDAMAEGIQAVHHHSEICDDQYCDLDNYQSNCGGYIETAKDRFVDLWDSLYAKRGYSFDSNPWVWAIEFRRVEDK